jgi:hypothetical protein
VGVVGASVGTGMLAPPDAPRLLWPSTNGSLMKVGFSQLAPISG